MTYQIDENTLKKIINEFLEEKIITDKDFERIYKKVLKRNKERLFEMAYPRKEYKWKVDAIIPQIIENICLLRHCVIYKQSNNSVHWGNELRGHIHTIMRWSIKNANDWKHKETVIREIFEDNDYFQPRVIELVIRAKFIEEGFDVKGKGFVQIISDCINTFNTLIHILSSDSDEAVDDFVEMVRN